MTILAFPLDNGEFFGFNGLPLARDGTDAVDGINLRVWEGEYRRRWDRGYTPSGRFGDATAEAARRVQREWGVLVTGRIDWDTWSPVWYGPRDDADPRVAGSTVGGTESSGGSPGNPRPSRAGSRTGVKR